MNRQRVSCFYDGNNYIGSFSLVGSGEHEAVSVQFDGTTISARLGGLRPEFVAKTLLGELVRERFVQRGKRHHPTAA